MSCAIFFVAVLMEYPFSEDSLSQNSAYSAISFSSAARSAATLPLYSSRISMTFWTGLTAPAPARSTRASAAISLAMVLLGEPEPGWMGGGRLQVRLGTGELGSWVQP